MAKIKLNLDANDKLSVTGEVTIPTADGKALKIRFDFIWRDREAMAELTGDHLRRSKDAVEKARMAAADMADGDDAAFGVEFVREAIKRDVETVLDVATGWNVDLPFDADTLGKFFRKYPAAASAIYQEYRTRMTEGKVGNL
jgi:hypothetical protein